MKKHLLVLQRILDMLRNMWGLLEKQQELLRYPFLTEEQILADRVETGWVLAFLKLSLNPFKEHVKGKLLFPTQVFGQQHYYSKQEVLRLFWRK